MFKLNLGSFGTEEFINFLTDNGKSPEVENVLRNAYHHTCGDGRASILLKHGINFNINEKRIYARQHRIYFTVKLLNNVFHGLISSLPEKNQWHIPVDSIGLAPKEFYGTGYNLEKYLIAEKKGESLFFTTHMVIAKHMEGHFSEFNDEFSNEEVSLVQALDEVAHFVSEYRRICFETANKLVPNQVGEFMDIIFKGTRMEPELRGVRIHSDPWLPFEEIWKKYREEHYS